MKTAIIDMDNSFKIIFDDKRCFKEVMIFLQENGYKFLSPDSRGRLHEADVEILNKPIIEKTADTSVSEKVISEIQDLKNTLNDVVKRKAGTRIKKDVTFKHDNDGNITGATAVEEIIEDE